MAIPTGTDVLVHCAAKASDWGTYAEFYESNVALTKQVLENARQSGVKKIIHISSNAVLGEEDCPRAKNENSPYRPRLPYFLENILPSAMNHYRVTKAEGEKFAREYAATHGLNLIVLRPVWIFGPREFHAGPYEYCKTVKGGLPFFPGSKKNVFHTVYVKDVARAIHLAATQDLHGIRIYNIGAKTVLTAYEYWGYFCKALGVNAPRPIPKWPLYPFVLALELLHLLLLKSPPLLSRARLHMFYANNIYTTDAAERELGFTATTDYIKAIKTTVRWWKLNGYLR
jgi:nucleoside-diphosphate-sugar epimerase